MAYQVIEDFRGGLDDRKSILTSPPGTLQVGTNIHINRGGEIEKRKAFVLKSALPANSFGLQSVRGNLYCFGSVASAALVPALPVGVNYQRLQHSDGVTAMNALLAVENFDGKIYAIARFTDGSTFHYYDGVRVTTWDTVAAAVASNANVASALQARIDVDTDFSATVLGTTITITAAVAGTGFTYDKSTVNGGSNADQDITLAVTTANRAAVAEVLATTSFEITGGSAGGGNQVSAVTIDGVDVLGAAVAWATSNSATATAVAAQINTYVSAPNYTAAAVGSRVTVSAVAGTGTLPNGFVASVTVGGTVTATTPANMAGGVAAVTALAQVITATVGGTFEAADRFTITLNGREFTVSGAASGTGTTARTLKQKLYSTTQSFMYNCAIGNPLQWGGGTGSNFINMSNQDAGSDVLTALGVYQGNMAVFSKGAVQVWYVAEDPAASAQLQVLPNIGTNAPRSVISIGESDVFFLALSGVRSLRARDSSNSAAVYDIGTPIDNYLANDLSDLSEAEAAAACGVVEPRDGRYWLAMGAKIYVFSFFPTSKVSAWSTYEPGFTPTDFAVVDRKLYVRGSNNNYYLYGGDNGATYEACTAEVVLPYLSGQTIATLKELTGIDVICQGEWSVYVGTDPVNPDERTLDSIVSATTTTAGRLVSVGQTTHVGLRLVSTRAEDARLSSIVVHYIVEEAV